jgi:hypothetical protein
MCEKGNVMEPELVLDNYSRIWKWSPGLLKYFMLDGDNSGSFTLNELHKARGPLYRMARGLEVEPIPEYAKDELVEFNMSDVGEVVYGTVLSFDGSKQIYTLEVRLARDKVRKSP